MSNEPIGETLRRLDRKIKSRTWGPVWSLVCALLTFGLLPLLVWPKRWEEFIAAERRDFVALAEWWRRRASPEQSQRMTNAIERLHAGPLLSLVATLLGWFMIAMLAIAMCHLDFSIPELHLAFYGWPGTTTHLLSDRQALHWLWGASLSVAYLCHWLTVRNHLFAIKSFSVAARGAAGKHILDGHPDNIDNGISAFWVIIAIMACTQGAVWGIPLALAGAAQRRYMTTTSPKIRAALAEQVRNAGLSTDHPGIYPDGLKFCRTRGCGSRMPSIARFCSRCGAPCTRHN